MSDMTDVLVQHHVSHADWDEREVAVICHCGVETVGEDNGEEAYVQEEALYARHLAAALSAAGFGPVQEARAEAWDEGYTTGNAHNGRRDANPYREDT